MNFNHLQTIYEDEADLRLARILSILIWTSSAAYAFILLIGICYSDWELIAVIIAGFAFQVAALVFLVRRHLHTSSLILVLTTLGMVTATAAVGQGIRDLAMLAFPIVFIFAGLILNPTLFRLSVALALASVGWLVLGEINGWLTLKPFSGATQTWLLFAVALILLLVAALAVELLATNVRKSLALARQEISQRERAEEALVKSQAEYQDLVDNQGVGVYRIRVHKSLSWEAPDKPPYEYEFMSDRYCQLTGISREGHFSDPTLTLQRIHPEDYAAFADKNAEANKNLSPFLWEGRMVIGGEIRWMHYESHPRKLRSGDEVWTGILMDITERKVAEEQLRYQSAHDRLTDIYNRAFFEAELARLEHSRQFPVSIIVADLDNLKVANDTQGHTAGDDLLRQTANLLRSAFREEDVFARIGGDEFVVLLPDTDAAEAEQIMSRVKERLTRYTVEHPDLPIQLSLGMATAKTGNLAAAFQLADQRMYANKAARKSNTAVI